MAAIAIDKTLCIKCKKCVRVCPAHIFATGQEGNIELNYIDTCIVCGHCVSICPTNAVLHSDFPAGKIHKIDTTLLPTPEQLMTLIKSRRSNRAFSSKPVPQEYIEQILEAAHRAPTASNLQQVEFTVITDLDMVRMIADITIEVFGGLAKLIAHPLIKPAIRLVSPETTRMLPQFERLVNSYKEGEDGILRGATAFILIHTPADCRFGCQDANLAYQNASLMAESLGVAQFYTGYVCAAAYNDGKKRLNKALGIKGKIHAGIALSMPDFSYPNYMDKKDIQVARF